MKDVHSVLLVSLNRLPKTDASGVIRFAKELENMLSDDTIVCS